MADQTHYKQHTKTLPVPVKEYYNAHEVAYLLQISKDKVYDLARQPGESKAFPMSLRGLKERQGQARWRASWKSTFPVSAIRREVPQKDQAALEVAGVVRWASEQLTATWPTRYGQ